MKICLLGDFSGTPDEGMKNISQTFLRKLSVNHQMLTSGLRDLLNPLTVVKLRKFSPEIIHYLHGPTIRSLVILKLVKFFLRPDVKVVVSATRPYFPKSVSWLIPFVLPDLILVQSQRFERFFSGYQANIAFYPNGVDCEKFKPVDIAEKERLREKYGIQCDRFVVLHVGHIKANRQLDIFKQIQSLDGVQVVIVGGTVEISDEILKNDLIEKGVIVIHEYLDNITEVYNASDLYVFPINDTGEDMPNEYNQVGAIDLPLSVFEAMACNLPVVTTRFGALERVFRQGDGFRYVDSEAELVSSVESCMDQELCKTREQVFSYDWDKIIAQIENEYRKLI